MTEIKNTATCEVCDEEVEEIYVYTDDNGNRGRLCHICFNDYLNELWQECSTDEKADMLGIDYCVDNDIYEEYDGEDYDYEHDCRD